MKMLEAVLDCWDCSDWEKDIVLALCQADGVYEESFWRGLNDRLFASTRCVGFDCYHAIARCHLLCVRMAPECSNVWANVTACMLLYRAGSEGNVLDAYDVGSMIGLFRAGSWLQQQQIWDSSFLSTIGACAVSLAKKTRVGVVNANSWDLPQVERALDGAVKEYLRPSNKKVAALLRPHIRNMLATISEGLNGAAPANPVYWGPRSSPNPQPELWLLRSLIHGALDIEHRSLQQLTSAAQALHPA